MSYNEAETRYYLIDPILREKGYNDRSKLKLETPAPVEAIGYKGRRRAGGGRTDYLLCVQAGDMPKPLPVGVLEAKKEGEDPLKGMQQAKGYSDATALAFSMCLPATAIYTANTIKPAACKPGRLTSKTIFPAILI